MIVVTAGAKYIDIDAYACIVAYAELLALQGKETIAASSAVWNESITPTLRALNAPLKTDHQSLPGDEYVLVDVSDPEQFDTFVDTGRVIEVLDHRPGFENYWHEKLGSGSHIELVGAAATLVYEKWERSGLLEKISRQSMELLAAAILDNTLNFGAKITSERDKKAYDRLAELAGLDDMWPAKYFSECQESFETNLEVALRNDTKTLKFKGLEKELCLGQVVVWDAKTFIANDLPVIASVLHNMSDTWMANVVSISDGRSYFVTQNDTLKNWATNLLDVTFEGPVATADRMWLRKEIIKASLQAPQSV